MIKNSKPSIFFLLLIILSSCIQTPEKKRSHVKPGNLEFYETYLLPEIKYEWQKACDISAIANPKQSFENISLRNLREHADIGWMVDASQMKEIDSILKTPEIMDLFPKDLKFMWSFQEEPFNNNQKCYLLYPIKITHASGRINSKDIHLATKMHDQFSAQITVNLAMNEKGADKWAHMTSDNIGRCIAMTMDEKVFSCPRVMAAIEGGNTQISGSFSMDEADELVARINAGK